MMQSADGDPVMLLRHDPVAYFTMGKPVRGDPNIKVSLPHRTYYFASEEHRRLFNASPAKFEPQHGGFCSNGRVLASRHSASLAPIPARSPVWVPCRKAMRRRRHGVHGVTSIAPGISTQTIDERIDEHDFP